MASPSDLDAAIFASINPRWTKVAMVLGLAAKVPGLIFEADEDGFEALAARLEQLVGSGHLLAQGDVRDWRFSEVRLPDSEGTRREP
jgi:hypothetical protein